VSPNTENQRLATTQGYKLNWEIKRENDLISINPIKKTKSAESIKPLTKQNGLIKSVKMKTKVFTEEDHLNGSSEEIPELYESFKNAILNLTDDIIEIVPKKIYIFKKRIKNIADIVTLKKESNLY
jgi:hypothetical protein